MNFLRFLCEGERAGEIESHKELHLKTNFSLEETEAPNGKWVNEVFIGFDTCTLDEGFTPLHIAIVMGNFELFSYLLKVLKWRAKLMKHPRLVRNALEATDHENFSCLLLAAKHNLTRIFKLVHSYDVDLHAQCLKMQNVLHYAVQNENEDLVRLICLVDADSLNPLKYAQNARGKSPLDLPEAVQF